MCFHFNHLHEYADICLLLPLFTTFIYRMTRSTVAVRRTPVGNKYVDASLPRHFARADRLRTLWIRRRVSVMGEYWSG
jgi:hypothetical protein